MKARPTRIRQVLFFRTPSASFPFYFFFYLSDLRFVNEVWNVLGPCSTAKVVAGHHHAAHPRLAKSTSLSLLPFGSSVTRLEQHPELVISLGCKLFFFSRRESVTFKQDMTDQDKLGNGPSIVANLSDNRSTIHQMANAICKKLFCRRFFIFIFQILNIKREPFYLPV